MDELAEAATRPTTDQLEWDGARRGGCWGRDGRSGEGADGDGCRDWVLDGGWISMEEGKTVDVARLLMRDMWEYGAAQVARGSIWGGKQLTPLGVRFHKKRMSGMCEAMTACSVFLSRKENCTLLMFRCSWALVLGLSIQHRTFGGQCKVSIDSEA